MGPDKVIEAIIVATTACAAELLPRIGNEMIGKSTCNDADIAAFGLPVVISQKRRPPSPEDPSEQKELSLKDLFNRWGHAVIIVGEHKYELRRDKGARRIVYSTSEVPYTQPSEWQNRHLNDKKFVYAVLGHTRLDHQGIDTICRTIKNK
ncbi:hypothetical protein FRB94_006923 [Tulasnella sp. JGI-2019a]|nr:hypothetical protein FRB94_006923 [Tulasnella sp. JGI-2019a]KAG9033134.1 hypothetical protein FRB95_000552 [Tulasnella sp. JGI-2019a]